MFKAPNTSSTFNAERYGRPEKLVTPNQAEDLLEEIRSLAETATVDIDLVAGDEAIERARSFKRALSERREPRRDAEKRLARELARGSLDFDAAVAEAARIEALGPKGILSAAVRQAETVALADAFTVLENLDGDAIHAECRRVVAETIEEIRALRKTLAVTHSAEHANAAGPKVAAAWSAYTGELQPRFKACFELVKRLRAFHWIAPLPLDIRANTQTGRPDIALADRKAAKQDGRPIRFLLDECCDAWEIGGPFNEQEARRAARIAEEAFAAQQGRQSPAAAAVLERRRPIAA